LAQIRLVVFKITQKRYTIFPKNNVIEPKAILITGQTVNRLQTRASAEKFPGGGGATKKDREIAKIHRKIALLTSIYYI